MSKGEAKRYAEGEIGIDLVADDPQIMRLADVADRGDLGGREDGTGRIVGRVEEKHARVFGVTCLRKASAVKWKPSSGAVRMGMNFAPLAAMTPS